MKEFIWIFPLIFIFRDFEELIVLSIWLKKNDTKLRSKYPFVLKLYSNFTTEGFSFAVYEEFVLCIAISSLAYFTNIYFFYFLWLGAFIACTLHFFIHIVQAIIFKGYIPSLITSILCLPLSILILNSCFLSIPAFKLEDIIALIVGIVMVAINLFFAQKLIGWFTIKFYKYV